MATIDTAYAAAQRLAEVHRERGDFRLLARVEGCGDLGVTVYRIPVGQDEQGWEVLESFGLDGYSDPDDIDAVLCFHGYERTTEWTPTDWGLVAEVGPGW